MSSIKILSESLANKIAAGEVVERPASVVKELIENAIDAGATQIKVEIEEGGLRKIAITDNGRGIPSEEVERAFERHATSKLYSKDELFRIRTLGFRGEALPSIASVSHLTIETALEDKPGKRLKLSGGRVVENSSAPSRRGTMISVEELFYNTPARLKHISSLKTEISHVTNSINRFTLANPAISFDFYNDGNRILKSVGNGDVRQAIASVYGVAVARKMHPIESENFDFKVTGYTSLPELTRANNKYITLIINGRYIHNYVLNRAVMAGYGSTLMVGRFPISVINIEMDPLLVDANVHPTKKMVRLSNEADLGSLIKTAIHDEVYQEVRIPTSSTATDYQNEQPKVAERTESHQLNLEFKNNQSKQAFEFVEEDNTYSVPETDQNLTHDMEQSRLSHHLRKEDSPLDIAEEAEKKKYNEATTQQFPELEYIGQLHGTYLLTQNQEGLYIIDQHAAQERVKYEYYKATIADSGTAMQDLLVPIVLEYPGDEVVIILDNLDKLEASGITLEPFGQNSFIVREHPTWMIPGQEKDTIEEMIDFFLDQKDLSVALYREATAIMMSCKRSIKANHYLSRSEAISLIEQLPECDNPYNCPHGRPVLVKITSYELEKMFKRVQDSH